MTLNTDLLDLVYKTIEADQSHWDQNHWRTGDDPTVTVNGQRELQVTCGTSFCFAGWAVQLGSEHKPRWANVVFLRADPEDDRADVVPGAIIAVDDRARRLLGLTAFQAASLFSGGNNLNDLKARIDRIKEESS